MSAKLTIKGVGELEANIEKLNKKAAADVMRKTARAGGTIIRKGMKRRMPKSTGDLRKSIRTLLRKQPGGYFAVTGSKRNFQGQQAPGSKTRVNMPEFYEHLVEYGFTARDGTNIPGVGYARATYHEDGGQALIAARKKMAEALNVELQKIRVRRVR
jgi:hypothetical protein